MISPQLIKVYDDIIKSEEDKRLYRGLELTNGMKVLLICDPTTDKSSAALDVHIGHMSDPDNLPGLAHFCEHMLFLGTEKYPLENEYNKFLNEHGGSSNAFTASDHTNYYFDVAPEFLEGALDRFAQVFLCPLFTESATDREVNAVNSEHEKNLQSDVWRMNQLERSTSNPTHAFSKFGTGSKETLEDIPKARGINVREELLKFHSHWYSSNIMALAVLGQENLDDLQKLVVELFSGVENKHVSVPEWLDHPFGQEQLQMQGFVVPVKDIRNLNITFPIPDLQPYYQSSPGHYLGHLIGHEGSGSLLSELKSKGWVSTLVGGQKTGAKGFGFFIVNVDLTEEGIEHVDDIVTHLFQYLNMLKKEGPQEWIFSECRDLSKMTFRFKDKERPQTYTCVISGLLHDFPIKEVLSGPYLIQEYKPELVEMVLDKLNTSNIRVAVIGKKFENQTDKKELWYGTDYRLEKMPKEILKKWENGGFNENLKLPSKNEFIPTDFTLVEREAESTPLPVLLKDTPMTRIWFKQDNEFLLPKAVLNFEFFNTLAYVDPLHCNMAYMFVQLFKDSLTEYTYAADLAGLAYSFSNTKYGMFLSIKGYNDKQHVLLEKIMDRMTHFEIEPKRFEILKEAYIRGLKNFQAEQPHQHAVYYMSLLLAEQAWTKEELLEAIEDLTLDRMKSFIPQLLAKLHNECLIHGNVTRQKALDIASLVENKLQEEMKTKALFSSQLLRDREVQLDNESHYIYQCKNCVHRSSCIEVYFQCGLQETHSNMVLELFSHIIGEPCFNILRTQEQLGYLVFSGVRRSNGVQGIHIIVQSDRSPQFLDYRIESFLNMMDNHLKTMTNEEFIKHRDALAARRLEKPKKLALQTAKYWGEIISQQYNFDRDKIEVAHLKSIEKEDVYQFYQEMLSVNAFKRRKLGVHIISDAPGGAGTQHEDDSSLQDGLISSQTKPTVISNITEFKSCLPLSPLVKPYINIPTLYGAIAKL